MMIAEMLLLFDDVVDDLTLKDDVIDAIYR
jgi:uncharacterized membrane protein